MHSIEIKRLGPIRDISMQIKDATIITGAQAAGKSTIARAVYFCRSIKDDLYKQITYRPGTDEYIEDNLTGLEKRLRKKFLNIFGSTWSMDRGMSITYAYSTDTKLYVSLEENRTVPYRNVVRFSVSGKIDDLLKKYDQGEFVWDSEEARRSLRCEIDAAVQDEHETLFIPAGRSLITVLTDHLAALIDSEARNIDYCMQSYIKLTMNLRGVFKNGTRGLLEEKNSTSQYIIDKKRLKLLDELMVRVLKGRYSYKDGEEILNISNRGRTGKYVKINFASSGQQDAVWIFNLLYYYILEKKSIFLILEEPESHLFPDAQKDMAEALGLFANKNNQLMVTTHSPYILGAFNNLLYANKLEVCTAEDWPIAEEKWIDVENAGAYFVEKGKMEDALCEGLIKNELIDGASDCINDEMDKMMGLVYMD